MKNHKHFLLPFAMAWAALLIMCAADATASDYVDIDMLSTLQDRRYAHPQYEMLKTLNSKCRRYGVVWSGGIALRFSDRITPRPVRSRWDRHRVEPIHCEDVDAFKQLRVADQPMIR